MLSLFVMPKGPLEPGPDETLEDLQRNGFFLLQQRDGFRFGEDSVLLAAFTASLLGHTRRSIQAADLGAGNGALSLLLAARLKQVHVTGVEISPRQYSLFTRNIVLNQLEQRLNARLGDVRQLDLFPKASLDLIISNPPYRHPLRHLKKRPTDQPERDLELAQALDMTSLNSRQLMQSAAAWLKPAGLITLVQRPENLPELLLAMQENRIEPVLLRPIVPLPGRKPSAILLAGRLHGKPGSFRYEPELLVCDRPGHYTPEVAAIYGRDNNDG